MVRTKDKKTKGDDAFKKQKQKVGKKKLAPVTATRAEVHAASLRIVKPADEKLDLVNERRKPLRTLTEYLTETTHHRDTARSGAFQGLERYLHVTRLHAAGIPVPQVPGGTDIPAPPTPIQLLGIMQLCVDRQTDSSEATRSAALATLTETFRHNLPLDFRRTLSFIVLPLTHGDKGTRQSGLAFLDSVLSHYPQFLTPAPSSSAASHLEAPSSSLVAREELEGLITAAVVAALGTTAKNRLASYSVLQHLLERVIPTAHGTDTNLSDHFVVHSLAKSSLAKLHTLWIELADVNTPKNVMRDTESCKVATAVLRCIAHVVSALDRADSLSKHHITELRNVLKKFPFSVEELFKGPLERRELAVALSEAVLPIALYPAATEVKDFVVSALTSASLSKPPAPETDSNGELVPQSDRQVAAAARSAKLSGDIGVAALKALHRLFRQTRTCSVASTSTSSSAATNSLSDRPPAQSMAVFDAIVAALEFQVGHLTLAADDNTSYYSSNAEGAEFSSAAQQRLDDKSPIPLMLDIFEDALAWNITDEDPQDYLKPLSRAIASFPKLLFLLSLKRQTLLKEEALRQQRGGLNAQSDDDDEGPSSDEDNEEREGDETPTPSAPPVVVALPEAHTEVDDPSCIAATRISRILWHCFASRHVLATTEVLQGSVPVIEKLLRAMVPSEPCVAAWLGTSTLELLKATIQFATNEE